jgi:hypothetical protein
MCLAAEEGTGGEGASERGVAPERALTPRGRMREISPFEHSPSGAPRNKEWHSTRACVFKPKAR